MPPSSPYFNVYTYSNTSTFIEKAIFGDVTYRLTDQLEGTAGVRYSSNGIGRKTIRIRDPFYTRSPVGRDLRAGSVTLLDCFKAITRGRG